MLQLRLRKAGLILFAVAALPRLTAVSARVGGGGSPFTPKEVAQGYVDGFVLAQPIPSRRANIDALEASDGTPAIRRFDRFGGLRVLPVLPGESIAAAIARLQGTHRYTFVEPDRIVSLDQASVTPTDPDFGQQWALNNTGTNSPDGTPGILGADVHAPAAWATRTSAASVIVAVVDSGARLTHVDLAANLWTNPNANRDGYSGDIHGLDATANPPGGDPTDVDGHGTHVAGIIGAVGNNALGISGVCWNVQIMPLKFIGASGEGKTSDEITCLDFAIAHGANLINASFGSHTGSASEQAAIQAAQAAGIDFVAAAQNNAEDNGLSPSYPCNYPLDNIVAVAATDNRDDLVYFSNFGGGNVDLGAPGYQILSLYNGSDTDTAVLSGTSMAAPMTTGALALLKAQFPADSYRQLINRLLRHVDADPNLLGKVQSGGRLNLASALGSAAADNAPFNDNFAARGQLTGTHVLVRTSNVGATREAGEPTISGTAGGASLWWEWTTPGNMSGDVTISTAGSAYSTLIGVYSGSSLANLTLVQQSAAGSATFLAQPGTKYEISVDGINGASGLTMLSIQYEIDLFTGSIGVAGDTRVAYTNIDGTPHTDDPGLVNSNGNHPNWFAWTPTHAGRWQFSAWSADFDPVMAVYSGAKSPPTSALTSAGGGTLSSSAFTPISSASAALTVPPNPNGAYLIQLDGNTDSGTNLSAGQYALTVTDTRWQAASGDSITGSPAVGADGTVCYAGTDGYIRAYHPDGSVKWAYNGATGQPSGTTASSDSRSVAIGDDGTVYVALDLSSSGGTQGGALLALNPDGSLKWTYALAAASQPDCSPVIASDGTVLVKDSGGNLDALDPASGTLKWQASVPGNSYAAPAFGSDGSLYLGSDEGNADGKLYAFSASGTAQWTYDAGAPIYSSVAIDAAGRLYFGTLAGTVLCVDAKGKLVWTQTVGGSVSSSPALGTDGTLYFGAYDHKLYALDSATGTQRWTYAFGGEVRASSPCVAVNSSGKDVVYLGSYDGVVRAINADGTLARTFSTGQIIRSSPALFGTALYFGSEDHTLYAYDTETSAAGSAWPMYLGGPRRLGRVTSDALAITSEPPASVGIGTGNALTLSVGATGRGPLRFQWYRNGTAVSGATDSTYFVPSPGTGDLGSYTVTVTGSQGSLTSTPAVVDFLTAPSIAAQPQSQTVDAGANVILSVGAHGGDLAFQWYWVTPSATTAIAGATGPTLSLPNIGTTQGAAYGSYEVKLSNSLGSLTSGTAAVTVVTQASLVNLSARAQVSAGTQNLVVGFTVGGAGTKNVLLRAVGPDLANFGVSGILPDPQLTLFDAQKAVLDNNHGWDAAGQGPAIVQAEKQTGAFQLPAGSADAGLLPAPLPAGSAYTAQVESVSGNSGVALAEVYDADTAASPTARLVNLSARASVGTGSAVLTAGLSIAGTTSETVLLRGIGPALANFGVGNALAAPILTVFQNQTVLATNTGWGGTPALGTVFSNVGAFGLSPSSADSALVITLAPGQYTVQVSGVNGGTGIGLVEIYEVR